MKILANRDPPYAHLLDIIFKHVAIDPATMVGMVDSGSEEEEPCPADPILRPNTPSSTSGSRKCDSSGATNSTASSPPKRGKSPWMVSRRKSKTTTHAFMESILEEFQKGEESCDQALKEVVTEKKNKKSEQLENIKQCLDAAIECGISQNSDEYYACTKVFKDEINIYVFLHCTEPDARYRWIRNAIADLPPPTY